MGASDAILSPKAAAVVATAAAGAATVAAIANQVSKPTSGAQVASTIGSTISAPAFINRATFGATDDAVARFQQMGLSAWFAAQVQAAPTPGGAAGFWSSTPNFHLQWIMRRQADFAAAYQTAVAAAGAGSVAASNIHQQPLKSTQFQESFWARAVLGDDQLRHRMALALSEIFVVSFESSTMTPRIAASWFDMLSANAFGRYVDLLKAVTLHPAMGLYLNITGNQQADTDPTRHPDQNYAREVLQLMSVGLVSLNADGSTQVDVTGASPPPFSYPDIVALANVFTGWGWYAKTPTATSFSRQPANGTDLTSPDVQTLIPYPIYHSQLSKTVIGAIIPAYTGPAPTTSAGLAALGAYQTQSLTTALNVISAQPNVAPFIGRRLIQRFVTSNPSAAYVGRVAAAFTGDPSKPDTYGNLLTTLTAVLTDPEAQSVAVASGNTFGKLREPVVRMTHWLRACEATSKPTTTAPSGNFTQFTDFISADELDQAPLEALSVFNFWTPDYIPPGTNIAKAGLVAPEFQAVDVLTVASYANLMISVVQNMGWPGGDVTVTYAKEIAALAPPGTSSADNNQALIDRINFLFFGGSMSTVLSARLMRVLASTVATVKAPTPAQESAVQFDKVKNAFIIALTSPEYIVQR